MSQTSRNGKIDLFKFIFSIIVIIYHFGNSVKYPYELFANGYIGVEFFFIVSGFLFAKSLSKIPYSKDTIISDSLQFMWRKYKSFLPYHFFTIVCTFITLSITTPWNFSNFSFELFDSIPDFLMLQVHGVSRMPLMGHEWYLSAMLIVMFILTPVIIKFKQTFFGYMAPVISFFMIAFLFHKYKDLNAVGAWLGIFNSGILRAAAEISVGCICYSVSESRILEKFSRKTLMITECILYLLVILYANHTITSVSEAAVLILLAAAVTISFCPKSSIRCFNNPLVLFLGKLSFPVYLCQIFVRQVLVKMNLPFDYFSYMGIYVVSVILISLLCIFICDNILKFMQKKRSVKP